MALDSAVNMKLVRKINMIEKEKKSEEESGSTMFNI